MTRRTLVVLVFASVLAVGVAYGSAWLPGGAPAWSAWAMALGTAASLVAVTALGAPRDRGLGPLALPLAFVFLVYALGFGIVLALPPADAADPTLWLGLPPRAAVILYGVGLLPLLAVPLAYALTFDRMTLSEDDLARVIREAAALRERAGSERPLAAAAAGEERS